MSDMNAPARQRLIVGMGATGLSVARFLSSRGMAFDMCDTRSDLKNQDEIRQEFPGSSLFTGDLEGDVLSEYQELIVSPGVAVAEPAIQQARQAGARLRGDVDLFAEYVNQRNDTGKVVRPVVAITGSNGKSTVTTLVGEILEALGKKPAVCGNIGLPVLDVLRDEQDCDCYVLELSSFQLETTHHLAADVACVLNISEDHMDRYPDLKEYHKAKHRIFQGCHSIVVNREDNLTRPQLNESIPSGSIGFELRNAAESDASEYGVIRDGETEFLCCGDFRIINADDLKIRGRHNQLNVLSAVALVRSLPIGPLTDRWDLIESAIVAFTGLPHRCAWVASREDVDFFNDSKGTNVGSTVAAIEGLAGSGEPNLILIAGGVGKDQDFEPLAEACEGKVKQAVLFGRDAGLIQETMEGVVPVKVCSDLSQALLFAQECASSGDNILFSPACASFDQFENYVHRGRRFEAMVREGI